MDKKILDVACGGRMFYFDKSDRRVLFCDNRTVETELCDGRKFSVKPDIQCDFTNLPFDDEVFRMVVFDPPHLLKCKCRGISDVEYGTLKNKVVPTGYQQIKYGALYQDWKDMLKKGFSECFRVLEPGGVLIFKWNETDILVHEVLNLTPFKPLFGNKCGKQSKTHWICFMKE